MPEPVREASRTALGVAALRAAHQVLDSKPLILEDPIALRLLNPGWGAHLEERAAEFQRPGARGLRSHVVLRSRFAEDCLAEAAASGLRQCVILGAGLDTFAYRQPSWSANLRIFEADHPASQQTKQALLEAAGVPLPSNLVFAPLDFETTSLREGLAKSGFDAGQAAFFSWLGVTMYLTEAAIDAVLGFVASLPPGSRIALTFAQPDEDSEPGQPTLADRAAAVGEPWITRFTPAGLEAKLRARGFSKVSILAPEDAVSRYYRGREDGLPPPRRASIALAEV